MRRTRLTVLAVTGLALLGTAGCGSEGSGGGGAAATATPSATAGTELTVTVRKSEGASPQSWTLRCDPAGGDHPAAKKACETLAGARKPFAPVPRGQVCTEIFGGPQVATVKGTWDGEKVDARFTRQDGCEITRWDDVAPVFPGEVGA
jgi:hypothetical protein